jgi:hypothetical protein
MPLPTPNLDDRTFAQLVEDARARIAASCPAWTDLSIGDPGIALVEVFAYLTETLIYRFNRVPDKAYVEFLRLLGVTLMPPASATANLVFTLSQSLPKAMEIPRGTRVTIARAGSRGEAPVFVTEKTLVIPPGETKGEVAALQCELIEGELLGTGTGAPGQSYKVARPPVVARIGSDMDITIGIEASDEERTARLAGRELNGKFFRTWREVQNFTDTGPDPYVYVLDRMSGMVTFAPAVRITGADATLGEVPQALAAAPAAGREIRAWYCRGGGQAGNVAANTLTVLKDNIPGVSVTNPEAAVGGRAEESLDNALKRGPHEFHSLERAVTARDFELIAARSGAVSRTRAFTRASLWSFAAPGTVEVVLVPYVEESKRRGRLQAEDLKALQTEKARGQIQQVLDERRPLGTTCLVNWAHYKCVKMKARIVAHPEEDQAALRQRIVTRLHETISPVPVGANPGWRFGQALRISTLYDAVLAEPSVAYVDNPQFVVEDVPEKDVTCLEADAFQQATWYAGRDETLYRSLDRGDGWDPCGKFADQTVTVARSNPEVPGLLAVLTNGTKEAGSRIHVSFDCGERWDERARTNYTINDVAWIMRDGKPVMLLATDVGLYELSLDAGASLLQVFVRSGDEAVGYHTVAAAKNTRGAYFVAIAARESGGTFLSAEGGRGNTFNNIGLAGEDVRLLEMERDGSRLFLWAGIAAMSAGDPGKGCRVVELVAGEEPAANWDVYGKNWLGGSCVNLVFAQGSIYAGTYDAGVLKLDGRTDGAAWQPSDVRCGLPLSTKEHPFERVDALATDPAGSMLMTAGASGVYRSHDGAEHFENCSRSVFTDKVSLPPNWLFCSGEHEIEVVSEADAD